MINTHDPRALFNAVYGIDGVRQNPPGTVIEYWRGVPDFEPIGQRKSAFCMARKLYEVGLCHLVQVKDQPVEFSPKGPDLGDVHEYSYRCILT